MSRTLRVAHLAALAALVATAVVGWRHLPAMMPTHFDGAGRADAWRATTQARWLTLPVIALGLDLLLLAAGRIVATYRWMINLPEPDRSRLRALPADRQFVIGRAARDVFRGAALSLTLVFLALQGVVWATAASPHAEGLPGVLVLPLEPIVVSLPIGIGLLRIQREIAREHPEAIVAQSDVVACERS